MSLTKPAAVVMAGGVGLAGVAAPGDVRRAFLAPHDAPAAVVWAVGDGANGSRRAVALARRIERDRPDRLLYLGDVYQSGTRREFDRNYDGVYGRLAAITAPTPGNHEWGNREQGYTAYWLSRRGVRPPPWYATRIAGWQVLSLNSEHDIGRDGRQWRWLRARMRERRFGTCRLAFFHRPRYSTGRHGDQVDLSALWRELEGRTALVVNGHDHSLQRHRPVRGTTAFVSGAGGHGLYSVTLDHARVAWASGRDYGALRLELGRSGARWRFVRDDGRVLDAGRLPCRRPA